MVRKRANKNSPSSISSCCCCSYSSINDLAHHWCIQILWNSHEWVPREHAMCLLTKRFFDSRTATSHNFSTAYISCFNDAITQRSRSIHVDDRMDCIPYFKITNHAHKIEMNSTRLHPEPTNEAHLALADYSTEHGGQRKLHTPGKHGSSGREPLFNENSLEKIERLAVRAN